MSFFLKAQEIALRLKKPDYMLNSRYSLSCCQIALGRYEEAGSGFEQLAAWMEQSGQEEAVLTFERLSKECYKWANQALHVEIEKLLQTNEKLRQDLNRAKLRSQILSGLSLVVRCGSILYNIYLIDCKSADIALNIANSIIAYLETIPRAISTQGDVNIGTVINSSVSPHRSLVEQYAWSKLIPCSSKYSFTALA